MHPAVAAACVLLTSILGSSDAACGATAATPAMLGYFPESAAAQRALEQRFDAQLHATELRAWLQSMSSAANHVGSPHDKENAQFMLQLLRSWGWDAQIETFEVLYPTLKHHSLELVEPVQFTASLKEPTIAGDATSSRADAMEAYNAYGADGDVTAELVYVNYGMPDDYQELRRRKLDVKGKIVIARYGGGWRGLKPKLAYEHGAVGCIIYSDPHEDGYFAGETYPDGGWRPQGGVQRGSVLDIPVASGDPLTPGIGATRKAKRLPIAQAKTVLKIPVLPISYADAQPLLAALQGMVAPDSWRGSLPITYHIGPGPAQVHVSIASDWSLKPAYDVIATIPGAQSPDEWVIRGNHRDGWVFGAWDPLSGTVAMMAEAKAIGALLKTGWKPRRTLVYASWDAEEPGLLGSTEWAETHAEELQRKAVVYVNSDTNARGFLSAGGSGSLQRLVSEVAQSVIDPESNTSVDARLRARMMVRGFGSTATPEQKNDAAKAAAGGDLPIAALGSGSDYSPFMQHLGIATLEASYSGEDEQAGVYHSSYDSFDHYTRFGDPEFAYGVTEAQTVGRLILRVANAAVLPMQFTNFAETVNGYLQELHKLTDDKRKNAAELARLLEQNAFELAADPTRLVLPPQREPEVPYLEFTPLDNAVIRLQKSAKAYDDAYTAFTARAVELSNPRRTELNSLLRGTEQTLVDIHGLPGRDWYRHLIYAPGLLTGYGVKTLPGVREAIEANRWDEANRYSAITARALAKYCERLDQATALLVRGP